MTKYYTGIGSRETPQDILLAFIAIGKEMAEDFTLRSGAAEGADSAFEQGCDEAKGKKQIFLPWKGFQKHSSPYYEVSASALKIAKKIHPAWDKCNEWVQKLHGRNAYQILGYDLKTPSEFVVCWTKDGKPCGGTATAINIAKERGIVVYNFGCNLDIQMFQEKVMKVKIDESKRYQYFF